MRAYRQGELLFIPMKVKDVEKFKEQLKQYERTTVAAEGEASGHKHELADPSTAVMVAVSAQASVAGYQAMRHNFQKVLYTATGTAIKHPDHALLQLPAGSYMVRSQREYDERYPVTVED